MTTKISLCGGTDVNLISLTNCYDAIFITGSFRLLELVKSSLTYHIPGFDLMLDKKVCFLFSHNIL